jgi:tetratricopeptide (TPR) repeat protein
MSDTGSRAYRNPPSAAQAGYRSVLVSKAGPAHVQEPERYRIGEKIGARFEVTSIHRGGMGVVYGAYDQETKRPRALKTLQLRFAHYPGMRELFTEEAVVWVRVEKHPHIVQAFFVQHYDGQPFVVTEYIQGPEGMGCDLRGWLGNPRLTAALAIQMAWQIAQGMQHATRKVPGLLHRDLKPSNILVDQHGRPRVTDFGLSGATDSQLGTPAYMSPEQWRGDPLDQRTDIYAFGCILYEMFAGHRLFAAQSIEEWGAAHLHETPTLISRLAEVPAGVEDFVFRCMSKEPGRRPAHWDEVVATCAQLFSLVTGGPASVDSRAHVMSREELATAAHSLHELGKYPEMLEMCERLLAQHPNYREGMINKIAALHKLRRWDEALATIDQVLALYPRDSIALENKSVVLGELQRNEESLAAVEQSLAIDPNHAHAWQNKGRALERLDRTEDAMGAYDRSLILDPHDGATWECKVQALKKLKRWRELVSAAGQATALNPVNARIWYEKALALENLELWDAALEAVDRTIVLFPSWASAWEHKVYVLLRLERWADLLATVKKARANDVKMSRLEYFEARSLSGLGRSEEALAAYGRAQARYPENYEVAIHRAYELQMREQWRDALAGYERALEIRPGDEYARSNRDKIAKRLNDARPPEFAGTWLREETGADADPPILVISQNPAGDFNVRGLYRQGFLKFARNDRGRLENSLLHVESLMEFEYVQNETVPFVPPVEEWTSTVVYRYVNDETLQQVDTQVIWRRVPDGYPSAHDREVGVPPESILERAAAGANTPEPAAWTDVAHLSRSKLAWSAALYGMLGIGIFLFLRAQDFRIPSRLLGSDRVLPAFFAIGILVAVYEMAGRLGLLPAGRCFFRAGPEGIWYRQPPSGLPLPAKEARIPWSEVTKWYPAAKTIVFETHTAGKRRILTYAYRENQEQIAANLRAANTMR